MTKKLVVSRKCLKPPDKSNIVMLYCFMQFLEQVKLKKFGLSQSVLFETLKC